MDGIEARGDRVQQARRVVLDAALRRQSGRVRHLVRAPGDRATSTVVERRPDRRGPDVERDDH